MADDLPDDRQLLKRICRGDEAAFVTLYERHQGAIYRFALHMSGSGSLAEEITQEVFMLLIRNPKGYDSAQGTLAAYLFGAARHLARRATHESASDVPLDESDYSQEVAQSTEEDALATLTRTESLSLLNKALMGLPAAYREVIVLSDLEEMSYAEVAKLLNCSAGTVASRLHRAHTMLKMKLGTLAGNKQCLA